MPLLNPREIATLTALANGIIPPDMTDAGAAGVNAGPRLAEKIEQTPLAMIYLPGIELAEQLARERHGRAPSELKPTEVHDLVGLLRAQLPAFFKQLRLDVSAMYLSDPGVWQRIGFPGPSAESGGYPDFDQPQIECSKQLKEPPL